MNHYPNNGWLRSKTKTKQVQISRRWQEVTAWKPCAILTRSSYLRKLSRNRNNKEKVWTGKGSFWRRSRITRRVEFELWQLLNKWFVILSIYSKMETIMNCHVRRCWLSYRFIYSWDAQDIFCPALVYDPNFMNSLHQNVSTYPLYIASGIYLYLNLFSSFPSIAPYLSNYSHC